MPEHHTSANDTYIASNSYTNSGNEYWEFSVNMYNFYTDCIEIDSKRVKVAEVEKNKPSKYKVGAVWGKDKTGRWNVYRQIALTNGTTTEWGCAIDTDATKYYFINRKKKSGSKFSNSISTIKTVNSVKVTTDSELLKNVNVDTVVPTEDAGTDGTGTSDEATTLTEKIVGILSGAEGWKMEEDELTDLTTSYNTTTDGSNFFDLRNMLGVFGMPYQFLPIADPRIATNQDEARYNSIDYEQPYGDSRGIGGVFADKIISSMPILFMSPGKPVFMGTYNEEEKKSILGKLIQTFHITDNVGIDDLLTGTGKYYTFKPVPAEYYKYVNPMCRIAAAYMGVANHVLDGVRLDSVNWMKYTTERISAFMVFQNAMCDYLSIPFYIESETQIQDSFDNSTTDSTLASTVNQISDTAREINFLLGNVGSATDSNLIQALSGDADISQHAENLDNAIGSLLGGNNFLHNLKDHLISIASGGKLIFPKIWSDSHFSRSYDITIKLRSPDKDNLSLYFNIIVPTLHLVGFVAPHMISSDPNAFGNPFLVRAIYKGFFNIDMGIITSMNITKGDQGNWNADGVPSTVDVTFTIQDLYETMSITKTDATDSWKYDTVDNTTLMDYIANFCGVNVYEPEIKRNLRMWFVNNFTNRVRDFFSLNIWGNAKSGIAWAVTKIYNPGR